MLRWLLLAVAFTVLLASPFSTAAQDDQIEHREQEFVFAANDPIVIESDERVELVLAIHNETIVNGEITEIIFVIDGNATINGTVSGEIIAISSHITLGPTAEVRNILLHDSTLETSPGAVILGRAEHRSGFFLLEWWSSPVFALILWVLSTTFLIAGGVVFTLASGQQFPILAGAASRHVARNLLTALLVWIGVPLVAVLIMLTIIGIPLGLVLIGLVLPWLWWLGYTLVGARIGSLLLRPFTRRHSSALAVFATVLGMLLLQLMTLLPYVGFLAIFLAGAYGSGALVHHLMYGRHERPIDPELVSFGPEFSRSKPGLQARG